MAFRVGEGIDPTVRVDASPPLCARVAVDTPLLERTQRKEIGYRILLEESGDEGFMGLVKTCLLYTSPSPRDLSTSRMPSSA